METGFRVTDTVLVVDDSTFIVEGLVALLKKNYRAIPSFGGEECLQILRTEMPSVIILDIMMEPMDGWETLSRIKDNPRTRHIPILMFSAKKISFEEAEAHRIRIDDFLTKPVSPKELLSAVARILERQDRKKRILSFWTARGVPVEKIEEYQALSSNLEIDTNLLAVMKKHLDHPSITELQREELGSSIVVLEERIRGTGSLIEAFFRDTGISLPGDSDPIELPGTVIGTPGCETQPLPREEETGNVPAGDSPPGTPENDSGMDEREDPGGISPAPVSVSQDLINPSLPEKNTEPGNVSTPGTGYDTSGDDQSSRGENIPGQELPGAFPDDTHSPAVPCPSNECSSLHSPGPSSGHSPGEDHVAPPDDTADDSPVEEHPSGHVPSGLEGLFEPEPPGDQGIGQSPEVPSDLPADGVAHPPESTVSVSLQETGSVRPPSFERDKYLVNPETSSYGRDAKIPEVPAAQPDTRSSGTGIIAAIIRLLFRGRQ